jgi:hypothetical protein
MVEPYLWSVELVSLGYTSQMQFESEFVLLEKPQLAWGNHKRPVTYSLVGQVVVLVLKRRAIVDG